MSNPYSIARLRRAMLQFVGGRLLQAVARGALVLVVVRLLPTADYGAYMLIVGIAEMLPQLCSFGILPVGQRYLPEIVESASRRDTYRFLAGITLLQLLSLGLICALLWVCWDRVLPYAAFTANQIEAARPALLLFVLVPAFRFVAELMQALLEQGRSQLVSSLVPLGRMLAIGVLLGFATEVTLHRILLLDAAVMAICLALAWVLMGQCMAKLTEPEDPQRLPIRAMVRHAWHMAAVQVMGSAQTPGALRLVIANALGIVESGVFAFLQSLQRVVGRYLPGELLRGLVRPMLISRSQASTGMDRMERAVGLLLKANLALVATGAVAVYIGGDRIVELASGGKFTNAGDSLLLMFLVLGFSSQRMMIDMLLQILDLTRVLRSTTVLLPLALVLVWCCSGYGLNAAIAAFALGIAGANAVCMWRLRVHTGRFAVDWWGTGGILLPSLVAALLGHALRGLVGPWLAMLAAALLLAVLLFAAKPLASGEIRIVDRVMGGLASRMLQPFARKVAV